MLLFGGRYTTPVMYVWPLRWIFANTHSIWSLTISSSERWVYVHFSAIYKDTPPPLPNNLVNPTCLYPFIPYVSNENGDSHVSDINIFDSENLFCWLVSNNFIPVSVIAKWNSWSSSMLLKGKIFSLHILQYQSAPVLTTVNSSQENWVQFLWTFLWQQLQSIKYECLRIFFSHMGQVFFWLSMMSFESR